MESQEGRAIFCNSEKHSASSSPLHDAFARRHAHAAIETDIYFMSHQFCFQAVAPCHDIPCMACRAGRVKAQPPPPWPQFYPALFQTINLPLISHSSFFFFFLVRAAMHWRQYHPTVITGVLGFATNTTHDNYSVWFVWQQSAVDFCVPDVLNCFVCPCWSSLSFSLLVGLSLFPGVVSVLSFVLVLCA